VTRVEYLSASAAVTVDIAAGTAQGTVAGDVPNVGHDTFLERLDGLGIRLQGHALRQR